MVGMGEGPCMQQKHSMDLEWENSGQNHSGMATGVTSRGLKCYI